MPAEGLRAFLSRRIHDVALDVVENAITEAVFSMLERRTTAPPNRTARA